MRNRAWGAIGVAVAFLLLNAPRAAAEACNELERSTPQQLADYLRSDRNVPSCVELAIDRLVPFKDPAAIDALIMHLDFRRVQTQVEIEVTSFHDYEWPAVTALFAIGARAIPALEKVLQQGLINELTFRNALLALVSIRRDDPKNVILFFDRAYSAAEDQRVRDRLLYAYKNQVRFCEKMHKSECLAAVNSSLTALPDPAVHF
jgi:hypothetical protein